MTAGLQPMPATAFRPSELGWRRRVTYVAHLAKAVLRQHHRELLPVLRPLIPDDGVVFDVGGHAGQFAKLFAGLAPRGRVYSFEPGGYALSILTRVVRLRRLRNVTVVPKGLSDAAGAAVLHMPVKASGSYGFGLSHLGSGETDRRLRDEEISLTTIDAFRDLKALDRLDVIKADIEGWELRMLAGGARTIARFRPAILLEVSAAHLARAGDTVENLWEFLENLGYRPTPLATAGGGFTAAPRHSGGDLLWLPEGHAMRKYLE